MDERTDVAMRNENNGPAWQRAAVVRGAAQRAQMRARCPQWDALSTSERAALFAMLASATAECSGRECGQVFTNDAAERTAYGALADEIRSERDELAAAL